MTQGQMIVYAGCLPVGPTQRRVLRGEEDARLPTIIEALEAAIEDRCARFGGPGRSFRDTSLLETIGICRDRLRHLEEPHVR